MGVPLVRRPYRLVLAFAVIAAWAVAAGQAQVVVLPGGPAGIGSKPSQAYDLAFAALDQGEYKAALELASEEYATCMKMGTQRWIDSIAAAAAIGECEYELGNFRAAVTAQEEAFRLAALHPNWLLSVQFPPQPLGPLPQHRVATWGRTARQTVPALIPDTMSFRHAGTDPQQVLQQGGVLKVAHDQPIRPVEIAASLGLALYRYASLLGDLARESAALQEVAAALARPSAPPNHYTQAWVDIALGTALWAQGKPEQALPVLSRGLLLGNQFDHPLTAWGLIVLGRIALDSDQPAQAAKYFEEATYTAADYGDGRALEEAFRLAYAAHMLAGTRGVPPSIGGASGWARGGFPVLHARLVAMQAECLASAGEIRGAKAALNALDGRLLRGEPGGGAAGAEAAHAQAIVSYAAGKITDGDEELAQAVKLAQLRSPRLFQTVRLCELQLAGAGNISDRQVEELFGKLLATPSPRDFVLDPVGTLATITAPREEAFELWLGVASRRGNDPAIEAAEATVRNRWLAAQPLGGRRVAVERLLAADPEALPPADAARRAALLAKRPGLAANVDRMLRLCGTLADAAGGLADRPPADGPEPRLPPGGEEDWKSYRALAAERTALVALIAAGREPTPIDFPPLLPAAVIRGRLAPRQLILSFHWTRAGLSGVLESRDRFAAWPVRKAGEIPAELAKLAKSMGLFDAQAPVATDKLLAGDWQGSAERIERLLFENSKITLAEGIDELVIVPDGWLWYLPFELLPIATARPAAGAAASPMLRDVCRIRYAPTRSLAVMPFTPRRAVGPIGIHAGRMARGDKPEQIAEVLAHFTAAVDRAVPLVTPVGGPPPALVGSVFDAILLFDDLSGDGPIATRPLVSTQPGQAGLTFQDWLAPPSKRPGIMLLPGMQTAVADGLKPAKLPARPGADVFESATDLIAAGAHTAVLSRWRVGGRTCVDLMTEFLVDSTRTAPDVELPPAAERWRRAVDIVTAECPDPEREPRLRQQANAVLADGRHPFLWAGYMLLDCGSGVGPVVPVAPAAARPAPPVAAPPPAVRAAP